MPAEGPFHKIRRPSGNKLPCPCLTVKQEHLIGAGLRFHRGLPALAQNQRNRKKIMKSKAILAGAAMAGLISGSFAVQAHAANVTGKAGVSLNQMGSKGNK